MMAFCQNCGASNPDTNQFCTSCGAPLKEQAAQPAQQPVYNQAPVYQQPVYQVPQPVAPVATGGLLAWSIITLLLCTIPGIVAIVQTANINKCYTVEEQQKKISSAKIWCIVGTVLGVLAVIGSIAANAMS